MGVKRKRALQLQEAPQSEPAAAAADLAGSHLDHVHQALAQGHVQSAEDPAFAQQLEDAIVQILQTRKAGATC